MVQAFPCQTDKAKEIIKSLLREIPGESVSLGLHTVIME